MNKVYAVIALYAEDMRKMEERQEEFLATDASGWDFDGDEGSSVRPYQVVNGTAIYSIRGKMLPESNFFTQIFGIATYEDIGNAISMMSQDEEVERVLMDVSTPGGAVSGISDLSDSWRKLNAVKPITTHSPGMLASAGMWLASNSTEIYASETADVGSIGVVLQHVSQERALDKAGIKVTEIKSAPLKHIGSPAKDLTSDELSHLQKKVDESAGLFKKQIYMSRGRVSEEAFTGETFIASTATTLGLIDGVKNFSEVFTNMSDAAIAEGDNIDPGGFDMKRKVTAAMADAAITNGADPDSLEIVSLEEYEALKVTNEVVEPVVDEPTAEELIKDDEPTAEEIIVELTETNAAIQAEIEDMAVELSEANVKIADLETQVEASNSDPLKMIAIERLAVMRVALGMTAVDMSEFPVHMLLTEYTAIDKAFKQQYKSGGTMKENAEEPEGKKANLSLVDKTKLRAVGLK